MEQPLKQRLIGATILISLAVIFIPMLVGHDPTESEVISIDIPEAPKDLDVPLLALPDHEPEQLAEVSISKESGVRIIKGEKPSIPPAPKIETVEGISAWVVQVGSFSDKKNAEDLTTKLKTAGFTAFVEESTGKNGDVYRVRVGPELSREKAEVVNKKLKEEQKLLKTIVVQYP